MAIVELRRYARAKEAVHRMRDESDVDPWSLETVFAVQHRIMKLRRGE